jgi:hypothetical protein
MAMENEQKTYYERLQKLNGSIKDDSFVEQNDLPAVLTK